MATLDSVINCGGYYQYYYGYSASSCSAACSPSTYYYIYSTCSPLASNCIVYGSDGNYATEGYYSDGSTCYSIFNDGQNVVRVTGISSCCQGITAINVFGTTILGEPTIDAAIYLDSNVGANTTFELTVDTDYGTYYVSVVISSGNSSGSTTQSIAPSGSDPVIYSYCVSNVDNSFIDCNGYNCSGYSCPCG